MDPDDSIDVDLNKVSSPGETQTASQPAAPADSPTAPGDKKTVLDIVRDAAPGQDRASPADDGKKGAEAPADADAKEGSEDEDEAAEAALPYHKDPRFQRVIRQRATYKARVAQLEPDATRYQNVQRFIEQNGLSNEDAADALVIAGLIKTDPVAAWERLKPIAEQLLSVIGGILPKDLIEKVQAGEMTEEVARELSKARAQAKIATDQRSLDAQRQQHQQATELRTAVVNAAAEWTSERQAKDPDFAEKEPLLIREIAFLQRSEGVPNTVEGVQRQLAKAYRAVNQVFASRSAASAAGAPASAGGVAPAQRQAIKPIRSGGVASDGALPKPKSVLEIVQRAG